MAFRCPHCGGSAVFDTELQKMRCQYCDSLFEPERFRVRDVSRETAVPAAGLALYTCSGCGAELQGTEESVVGFCPYCGGQSLLKTKDGGQSPAERMVPFQITREQCAELYRDYARKVRYLPRDFRDPEHLKSFTGIYIPYYEYDVELGAADITGTKTVERHARYDVVNTYRIDASAEGDYCGVSYDASRYLDDEIAARVLPFDTEKQRPFDPSYLSGFYADASTVPPETYYQDAAAQAAKDVVEEVAERVYTQNGIEVDKASSHIEARTRGWHSALLPLWFLTWRKGDRVAYAVLNGESGKIVSDLPVDMKAFGVGCAVIAAILFALLELLFQPTPLITSVVSLIAGALMARSIRSSTKRIFEKQTHLNDKGWTQGAEDAPAQGKKRRGPSWVLLLILVIAGIWAVGALSEVIDFDYARIVAVAAAVYLVLVLRRVAVWQRDIPEKQPILAILLVLAGVLLNAAIVFISPVSDGWYYLGDAVCILILVLASAAMTRVYNLGTMRPLPKLFDRGEIS